MASQGESKQNSAQKSSSFISDDKNRCMSRPLFFISHFKDVFITQGQMRHGFDFGNSLIFSEIKSDQFLKETLDFELGAV